MSSNANFYLPADEPAATYLLNMTSGGVIGFDTSTYATTAQLHTQNTDTGTDGTAFTIGDGTTVFTINTGATDDTITIEQGTYDSVLSFTQPGAATQTYTFATGGTVWTSGKCLLWVSSISRIYRRQYRALQPLLRCDQRESHPRRRRHARPRFQHLSVA